jgi:hypothetical protein
MDKKMKLNVGSGKDYREGWINLDFYNDVNKMDVKHDLENYPYPFQENYFDEIELKMILEHMSNPIKCLHEIIRIAKNECKVTIIVPHATAYSNFTAFDHRANFTESSFDELILKEAGLGALKLKKVEFIYFNKWKRYIPFKGVLKIFLNGIYDDLKFEFEVKK